MAFEFYQDDLYTSPQMEYLAATAGEAYVPGELLKLGDAGTATLASGTDTPAYLCNQNLEAAAEGDLVQAVRLRGSCKLRTTLSADGAALAPGNKVTISDDGLQATATTGGALEIASVVDSAEGGAVIVRV